MNWEAETRQHKDGVIKWKKQDRVMIIKLKSEDFIIGALSMYVFGGGGVGET